MHILRCHVIWQSHPLLLSGHWCAIQLSLAVGGLSVCICLLCMYIHCTLSFNYFNLFFSNPILVLRLRHHHENRRHLIASLNRFTCVILLCFRVWHCIWQVRPAYQSDLKTHVVQRPLPHSSADERWFLPLRDHPPNNNVYIAVARDVIRIAGNRSILPLNTCFVQIN